MAYGILVWVAMIFTQAQEPPAKQAAPQAGGATKAATNEEAGDRLKEARRCCATAATPKPRKN